MSVTFNGVTIPLARTNVGVLSTRDKVVEFPGADGVEVLPMGKGARDIEVQGVSESGTPSRSSLEGLMDDDVHDLSVDGETYANVRCIGVAFGRRINTSPGGYRAYFTLSFRQEVPD